MEIDELRGILTGTDTDEKIEILSHLCDVFQSYNNSIGHFKELIALLLDLGLKEQNVVIKEEIFNSILIAATYKSIDDMDFDILAAHVESLPEECLHPALTMLGFTHNKKYLSCLTKYLDHENKNIRADAITAFNEIQGYWVKQ